MQNLYQSQQAGIGRERPGSRPMPVSFRIAQLAGNAREPRPDIERRTTGPKGSARVRGDVLPGRAQGVRRADAPPARFAFRGDREAESCSSYAGDADSVRSPAGT